MTRRVDALPIPYWLTYILFGLVLFILGYLISWSQAGGGTPNWPPIFFVVLFQVAYFPLVIHYMDKLALRAFSEVKPIIKTDPKSTPDFEKFLTIMPAKQTRIVSLLSFLIVLILGYFGTQQAEGASSLPLPSGANDYFEIYAVIVLTILWQWNGMLLYHSFRQLRTVDYLLSNFVTIHPFHQKELFTFSKLSATIGFSTIFVNPLWIIFDPGITSLVISVTFMVLSLIAFIVPLLGVHRILEREKDRLLDQNGIDTEESLVQLNQAISSNTKADLEVINLRLSTLEQARTQIDAISTWPWKLTTLRQFSAAIVAPIFIWLIQYYLSNTLL
jgi:hypothetical protein